MRVKQLAGAVGAVIEDVRLSAGMDAGLVADIRAAWLAHGVVFFHDQDLPPAEFVGLAQRFGTPVEYPFVQGIEGFPEVIPVLKLPHERVNFGGVWHTDTAYLDRPPMATMLVAREVPEAGGDTMFASLTAAWAALSPAMQAMLRPLRAANTSAKADVSKTREDRIKDSGKAGAPTQYEALHPVMRIHPETGRPALYVNAGHTARFEGMTEAESAPLLEFLFRHSVSPEFTCRFRWGVGSLALWDNRCCLHFPLNDYHGQKRLMHRVTLGGDVPG